MLGFSQNFSVMTSDQNINSLLLAEAKMAQNTIFEAIRHYKN